MVSTIRVPRMVLTALWGVSSHETGSDPCGVQFVSRVPRGLAQ